MVDILTGVLYPFRALALLNRTPRLWGYVIAPILVNVVVAALLYFGLFAAAWQAVDRFLTWEGALGTALLWLARAVVGLTLALGIGFLLVRFGVVLGAPWYSQLSEELEALYVGETHIKRPFSLPAAAYDVWRALLFESKKLALALAIWLPSLLLLLVPGVGAFLQMAANVLLGATIACLDFFDGPLERRRWRFRAKLAIVRRMLPGSLGFGLLAFALVSIPLVNLLAIPLCVTAGNMLVIERGGLVGSDAA
ncbi:MAG: EI24 domain-containing protein [Oscillochloridaceae bacterium]|nr:EI24 domain-containing protein [Chloroflexaceae bacterium]MDW8390306.1 EI24 domain-containing protein [Oscillochloridaceae bacterium]